MAANMVLRAFVAACFAATAVKAEDHWAVIVAGSNGFDNYRHQADVCHAYHVLISRGFHAEKIIVMMYDDVAHSSENPFPGKLFNHPAKTMAAAVDVYAGCKIDYTKKDVTPAKFAAVLTGDADAAGGRVLQSKADDHVFVNFVDHGAVGLIAFPGETLVMHAKTLISTLQTMHQKGMYKQLTFYLESCESGSMFQNLLPTDLPVYAVTAANAKESSYGTYCSNSKVAGKDIGSCLGDLFSVKWMMDSDKSKGSNETLKQQFHRVQTRVKESHVMHYGEFHQIGSESVDNFQGPEDAMRAGKTFPEEEQAEQELAHASAVDARNAKLHYLYQAYLRQGTSTAAAHLTKEIQARQATQELRASLEAYMVRARTQSDSDEVSWTEERLACHEQAVAVFGETCGWTATRLPLSKTLYKLCIHGSSGGEVVATVVRRICTQAAEIVV